MSLIVCQILASYYNGYKLILCCLGRKYPVNQYYKLTLLGIASCLTNPLRSERLFVLFERCNVYGNTY